MKFTSYLICLITLLFSLQAQEPTNNAITSAIPAENNTPATNEPVPYPQQQTTPSTSKPEAKPKEPPKKFGDCTGPYWIGQRIVSERHAGWGWIKKEDDGWNSAKWSMIQETPRKIPAPGRFYSNPNADDDVQYKLYGDFATYKGYEPNIDTYVSVFILKGFEVIGHSDPISRKLPGPTSSQPGRISERAPSRQQSLSDE